MSVTYKAVDPESGNRWLFRRGFIGDDDGLEHCLRCGDAEYDRDSNEDPVIDICERDSAFAEIVGKATERFEASLGNEYSLCVGR